MSVYFEINYDLVNKITNNNNFHLWNLFVKNNLKIGKFTKYVKRVF